jgi:hypothetical protein
MATNDPPKNLNFDDLSPVEVPVSVRGKRYTLREATGDAACKWRNAQLAATELGPDGKVMRVKGLADLEPMLVSLCLFDEQGKPVPAATVREWPARVIKAVYDECKRISQLDEAAETADDLKKQRDELDKRIAKLENPEGNP